jgi:hypothetical protein
MVACRLLVLCFVFCVFCGLRQQFPPKVKKKLLLIIPDWQADEFVSELYSRLSVILPLMYVEEGQLLAVASRKIRRSVRKRCFVPSVS